MVFIGRRDAQSKVVFYRQIGQLVQYSFDRVLWYDGFLLPIRRTVTAGNKPYDPAKGDRYYIELYRRKFYTEAPLKQVINNFNFTFNRTTIINNYGDLESSTLTEGKVCTALRAFLIQAREYGLAIRNGHIEPDDIEAAWKVGSAVVGAGATLALANPIGAGAAAVFGAGIGAVLAESESPAKDDFIAGLVSGSYWTDEELQDYLCCLWEQLKDGDFNYNDFKSAGEFCEIGAWDEIATRELYASFIASLKHFEVSNNCICETCEFYYPADGQILTGIIVEDGLITQNNVVSGSLRRMQSRVRFTIPNQVITKIEFSGYLSAYENVSDPDVPTVQFISVGTGGGFTPLVNQLEPQTINPAHFALTPVTSFDLIFQSSTCSACSTAQLNTFAESYFLLSNVKVCGVLA